MRSRAVFLLASAAVVSVSQWTPARAQQGAQPAASAGTGMEEIVVTARRRDEKIQTVPVAITAFSQTDIEQKRIEEVHDLIRNVPSMGMSVAQSDTNAPFSVQLSLRGLEGTVPYFAEVPSGRADFNALTGLAHGLSPGYFFDLDHVEIDKGPQGTLFGKNSIGGLISLMPKKPTTDFEGYAKVTLGNYGDREFEGAVNVPIVEDKLLVRIAGQSQTRDGYTKDAFTGKDYDDRNYQAWRVGVTLRPSDDFENYFLYTGYWQHSNGSSAILTNVNPNFPLISRFNPLGVLAQQQALGPREELGRTTPGIGKDYFYGFTNISTWDVLDNLTIKNIAAANVTKTLATQDSDGTFMPIASIGDPINPHGWSDNSVQYTEELQLQGKSFSDKLSWVFGGYLEFDHPLGQNFYTQDTVGSPAYYHFWSAARSQALFAHGIYDLSDFVEGLKFTAGYRYTWDYASVTQTATSGVDQVVVGANGKLNCAAAAFFDRNCVSAASGNFQSPGWNVSLEEQLTPETLVYVRSGNAYRPGGFNLAVSPIYQKYQPEHVTDVEIGVKTEWDLMGMHARTNFDLFNTDYKNVQIKQPVTFTDQGGTTRIGQAFMNGGGANVKGGEFEGTFIPVKGLEIAPHFSYVYARYDKYPGAAPGSLPPFLYFPKVQYGITGTYHLPIDASYGDVAVTLNYSYNGQQYDSIIPAEKLNILPSYDQLDIRIDWTNIMGRPFDLGFFMTNATDNLYATGAVPLYTQLGIDALAYNEPRMFGFSLKYRFGPGLDPGF